MYKEKFEKEKYITHKARDEFVKKIEKSLTDTGITEEEYDEIKKLFRN